MRTVAPRSDGLSLEEIGRALDGSRIGISPTRVKQIIRSAMSKLRELPIVQELFYGALSETQAKCRGELVDQALARAKAISGGSQ